MKTILVSKCSSDIEQYVEFKMSVLISPSKSLISSPWVTYVYLNGILSQNFATFFFFFFFAFLNILL